MPIWLVLLLFGSLVLCGCAGPGGRPPETAPTLDAATPTPTPAQPSDPARPGPAQPPTHSDKPRPSFDPAAAFAVVEHLAVRIGPREATSTAFTSAADFVAARLAGLGYQIERPTVPVPAGNSWGVPVPSGSTQNIIATPPGFQPLLAHRLIGAHLDTVPQAPGAEDNASGVAVLLELARIAAEHPPAVPVAFVAFGGEEPRGTGDELHHFGSQHLVAAMDGGQRGALIGMVALDRVGVPADHVPVCHGGLGSPTVSEALVAAAANLAITVQRCENRASDHWSFEKAGMPAARVGSVPYPGYHSAADQPGVVDPAQLDRVGRIVAEWMFSPA